MKLSILENRELQRLKINALRFEDPVYCYAAYVCNSGKSKAFPLHAMMALGEREEEKLSTHS